ncbi:MAG: TIM barrel protein [Phycisphaerae bacterium]
MTTHQDHIFPLLDAFKIELPSWGFADTGTRFGKFLQDASAVSIEEKLADAGHVHKLTGACPTVAVHTLWDFKKGQALDDVCKIAQTHGVRIGAINPNVFEGQEYKWGSLSNRSEHVRNAAVEHILDSVAIGKAVGSQHLSLWFGDGTNYPGQSDIIQRKHWMAEALQRVYTAMPDGMTMLLEYKPFEPAFYATDIADWGMAYWFAKNTGARAKVLVDIGHHYQAANVEQIVAWLLDENMLGGFHFNDRKYADDDLTLGSIDPFQVFRIFHEIENHRFRKGAAVPISYVVDQSHNLKPKIDAMIQTVDMAQQLYVKALLVDRKALAESQRREDLVASENILRQAFLTDTRPVIAEWRKAHGLPADPLDAHRRSGYEKRMAVERRAKYRGKAGGGYSLVG